MSKVGDEADARFKALLLRDSPLTEEEAALLLELFPRIFRAHESAVWDSLRRRSLKPEEADDLVQETFLTLYEQIVKKGFPENLRAMALTIAAHKLLNYLRARRTSPLSLGLPTSSQENPPSLPDLAGTLDGRALLHRILPLLSPDQREVVEWVLLCGQTIADTGEALGLPTGTIKSRLAAAKRALHELAQPYLPPSQRSQGGPQ